VFQLNTSLFPDWRSRNDLWICCIHFSIPSWLFSLCVKLTVRLIVLLLNFHRGSWKINGLCVIYAQLNKRQNKTRIMNDFSNLYNENKELINNLSIFYETSKRKTDILKHLSFGRVKNNTTSYYNCSQLHKQNFYWMCVRFEWFLFLIR